MAYSSLTPPTPLAMIPAPVTCAVGPLTQAASEKLETVLKFRLGLSGTATNWLMPAVGLKSNAPLVRPGTQEVLRSRKFSRLPVFALVEASAAVAELAPSSKVQ